MEFGQYEPLWRICLLWASPAFRSQQWQRRKQSFCVPDTKWTLRFSHVRVILSWSRSQNDVWWESRFDRPAFNSASADSSVYRRGMPTPITGETSSFTLPVSILPPVSHNIAGLSTSSKWSCALLCGLCPRLVGKGHYKMMAVSAGLSRAST